MADIFETHSPNLTSPASAAEAVVPNDVQQLPTVSRGIYVGGGGSLRVEFVDSPGQAVTLQSVQAGVLYPVRVAKIFASGTTATGIVVLW